MAESRDFVPHLPAEECPQHLEEIMHIRRHQYKMKPATADRETQISSSDSGNTTNTLLSADESKCGTSPTGITKLGRRARSRAQTRPVNDLRKSVLDAETAAAIDRLLKESIAISGTQDDEMEELMRNDSCRKTGTRKTVLDPETAALIDCLFEESRARNLPNTGHDEMTELKRKDSYQKLETLSDECTGNHNSETNGVRPVTDGEKTNVQERVVDSKAAAAEYLRKSRARLFAEMELEEMTELQRKDSHRELDVVSHGCTRDESHEESYKSTNDSSTQCTEDSVENESNDDEDNDEDRRESEFEPESSDTAALCVSSDKSEVRMDVAFRPTPVDWNAVGEIALVELEMIKESYEHSLIEKLEKFGRLLNLESRHNGRNNQDMQNGIKELVSLIYEEIEEEDEDREKVVYPLMSDANEHYDYWDLSTGSLRWCPSLSQTDVSSPMEVTCSKETVAEADKENTQPITVEEIIQQASSDIQRSAMDNDSTSYTLQQDTEDVSGATSTIDGKEKSKSLTAAGEVADEIDGLLKKVVELRGGKPMQTSGRVKEKTDYTLNQNTTMKLPPLPSCKKLPKLRPLKVSNPERINVKFEDLIKPCGEVTTRGSSVFPQRVTCGSGSCGACPKCKDAGNENTKFHALNYSSIPITGDHMCPVCTAHHNSDGIPYEEDLIWIPLSDISLISDDTPAMTTQHKRKEDISSVSNNTRMANAQTSKHQRSTPPLLPKRKKAKRGITKDNVSLSKLATPVIKGQKPLPISPKYKQAVSKANLSIGGSVLPFRPMRIDKTVVDKSYVAQPPKLRKGASTGHSKSTAITPSGKVPLKVLQPEVCGSKVGRNATVKASKDKDAISHQPLRKVGNSGLSKPTITIPNKVPVESPQPKLGNSKVEGTSTSKASDVLQTSTKPPVRKRLLLRRNSQFKLLKQSTEVQTLIGSKSSGSTLSYDQINEPKQADTITLPKLERTKDGEGWDATAWIKAYNKLMKTATAMPGSNASEKKDESCEGTQAMDIYTGSVTSALPWQGVQQNGSTVSRALKSQASLLPDISGGSQLTSSARKKMTRIYGPPIDYSRDISGGSQVTSSAGKKMTRIYGPPIDYSRDISGGSQVTSSAGKKMTRIYGPPIDYSRDISGESQVTSSGGKKMMRIYGPPIDNSSERLPQI